MQKKCKGVTEKELFTTMVADLSDDVPYFFIGFCLCSSPYVPSMFTFHVFHWSTFFSYHSPSISLSISLSFSLSILLLHLLASPYLLFVSRPDVPGERKRIEAEGAAGSSERWKKEKRNEEKRDLLKKKRKNLLKKSYRDKWKKKDRILKKERYRSIIMYIRIKEERLKDIKNKVNKDIKEMKRTKRKRERIKTIKKETSQ